MDNTIGMVLDTLDNLKIADKTYVIYTADHGTPGRNGPLRGGKGGLWNGGIRIPLIIRGPLAKAGAHSHVRTTGADLVPTIADLAGASNSLPKEVEGGSLKQLLSNPKRGTVDRPREELAFHFPHYDKDALGPVSAIVVGDYKLIRAYEEDRLLLFDLSNDLGEQKDLAEAMPEKATELAQRLSDYLADVDAQLPRVREGVAPGRPTERTDRRRQTRLRRSPQ